MGRAGVGWGPGPNSGLPFWLGAHDDIPSLLGLMPAGRSVDIVNQWESEGHYLEAAGKDPGPWSRSKSHPYLVSGQASAVQWMSSPFCSGKTFIVPTSWPSSAASVTKDYHLNCSVPPTYTGSETADQKTAKQRRVWQIAADGWMDPVWRAKLLLYKQNYFVKQNLRNIRIVMRVAHELNTATKWGNKTYRPSYGMMLLTSVGDYQLVQEGLRRYMQVFLDVFGNVQSSIPGDFAYADDQLWPYWNTGPGHKGPVNSVLTCPSNAKLVGPDYYNFWPATLTDAEFELIKQHPGDGHAVLLDTPGIGAVPLDITRHHHERLDGSGYPDGLQGDSITAMARMAAIVDVYDAITADRCYHQGLPAAEALRKMWEWSASHFDQKLLQGFMRCVGIYPVGSLVRLESGRLGVVVDQNEGALLTPRVRVFFSTRSNAHIPPEVVDLGRKLGHGGGDRIVSAEAPDKWGVDPARFLTGEA